MTATTKTLTECDSCGFPHIVGTATDGTRYLVGINECSRCGGTTFTMLDDGALGTSRRTESGES